MNFIIKKICVGLLFFIVLFLPSVLIFAYTANKVWVELRPSGTYRVYINYTIPALKEMRECYVDFKTKKEAETFYFNLIKGADFFPPEPKKTKFINDTSKPDPW